MRNKLLALVLVLTPCLGACGSLGFSNPQTEWTDTAGPGDQAPESNIQSTVDLSALADVEVDPPHAHPHHAEHAAEPEHRAEHGGSARPAGSVSK